MIDEPITVETAGLAIDYAAAYLRWCLEPYLTEEDYSFEGLAVTMFQQLLARDFRIYRVCRKP